MARTEFAVLIGLHRAVNAADRETSRIAAAHGLTLGQFAVLEALANKGDLTVGQVQEKILSSSGTVPVIVRNLERDGLLEVAVDERDRRRRLLHITSSGRDLVDEVFPENERAIEQVMSCWTAEEQRQLTALLRKLPRPAQRERTPSTRSNQEGQPS